MIIRLAKIEDAYAMSCVHAKTWRVAYKGIFSQKFLQTLKDNAWEEKLKIGIRSNKQIFLVAEMNEKVVGCVTAGVYRFEECAQQIGEIYSLYVLPGYQKQGIGKALLEVAVEKLSKKYKEIRVLAVDRNEQARCFYERVGFFNTNQTHKSQLHGGEFVCVIYALSTALKTDEKEEISKDNP